MLVVNGSEQSPSLENCPQPEAAFPGRLWSLFWQPAASDRFICGYKTALLLQGEINSVVQFTFQSSLWDLTEARLQLRPHPCSASSPAASEGEEVGNERRRRLLQRAHPQ